MRFPCPNDSNPEVRVVDELLFVCHVLISSSVSVA